MKNIIVPTDFSDNANNALQYAIKIANHFESKIHLINIFEVRTSTGSLVSIRDFLHNDAEENLEILVQENKNRFLHSTSMEAKAIEGYPITTICRYAENIDADMIIMGTQGSSGLKEIFMGSNTSGVINKSKIPVLAIPSGFKYQRINDIVLAVDSQIISTEKVLLPLIHLAKEYKAKIKAIHVKKMEGTALIDAGLDIYLSEVDHTFQLISDDNINHGINKFINKTKPNLLCMIHRTRGRLGNLFHRSVTNKEAFNSPVPLLVLRDSF